MSDPSVPWLVAGYAVTGLLLGAYLLHLWRAARAAAKRRAEIEQQPR